MSIVKSDFWKWGKRFPEKGWCEDGRNKINSDGKLSKCENREVIPIPAQFPCGVCKEVFTVIHTHCSVCQMIIRIN